MERSELTPEEQERYRPVEQAIFLGSAAAVRDAIAQIRASSAQEVVE